MQKKNVFSILPEQKPTEGFNALQTRILSRVQQEQAHSIRAKVWAFASGSAVALGTVVAVGVHLYSVFVQSGFYQYLSLALSGDGAVFAYWKELGLSLIESAPTLAVVALFVALGVFVWSAAKTVSQLGLVAGTRVSA